MKRVMFLVGTASVAALGTRMARADDATPAPSATSDLSYDDAAVHYSAPAGWVRVPTPPPEDGQALAGFAKQFGANDVRQISLTIKPDDSTLDGIDRNHEVDMRSSGDGSVFINKRTLTTLANGMPAWWLAASFGEAFKATRLYEWVVTDTRRSIVLAYGGRDGYFEEKEAQAALSTLSVVVYPGRP